MKSNIFNIVNSKTTHTEGTIHIGIQNFVKYCFAMEVLCLLYTHCHKFGNKFYTAYSLTGSILINNLIQHEALCMSGPFKSAAVHSYDLPNKTNKPNADSNSDFKNQKKIKN